MCTYHFLKKKKKKKKEEEYNCGNGIAENLRKKRKRKGGIEFNTEITFLIQQ